MKHLLISLALAVLPVAARCQTPDPTDDGTVVRAAVSNAAARGDYDTAYYTLWQYIAPRAHAMDDTARIALYNEALGYVALCPQTSTVTRAVHLSNTIEMLCEQETYLTELGRYGAGYVCHAKAAEYVHQLWGAEPTVAAMASTFPESAAISTSYLLDRAVYEERAGQPRVAEATIRLCTNIIATCLPSERASKLTLCRSLNNLGVLVDAMGRDDEAAEINASAGQLKVGGESDVFPDVNQLRYDGEANGPSEEFLTKLEHFAAKLDNMHRPADSLAVSRRIATLLYRLGRTDEAQARFASVIESATRQGFAKVLAEAYWWRGKMRGETGLAGAEDDFAQALNFYRREGLLLNQARVYTSYAKFLRRNARVAEALAAVCEARRLYQSMDVPWLLPDVMAIQATLLAAQGRLDEAEQVWQQALELARTTAGFPAATRFALLCSRARYLTMLGRTDEAAACRTEAQALADTAHLTAYQRRALDLPLDIAEFPSLASTNNLPAVELQPYYVSTRTPSQEQARAWFWLYNSAFVARDVTLAASGPGGSALSFTRDGDRLILSVNAGTGSNAASTVLHLPASSSMAVAALDVAPGADARQIAVTCGISTSRWDVIADAERAEVVTTIHASLAGWSSFWGVTAYHEIGGGSNVNYRVRPAAPARVEIYNAATGALLAVDADGDGSFLGQGDQLTHDADANGVPDTTAAIGIFVKTYPLPGQSYGGKLDLTVELQDATGWHAIGSDRILDFGSP